MILREKLLAKRQNYARSLAECDALVLNAAESVRNAKRNLATAKEARAAAQTGLQVVNETLADIAALEKTPAAPAQPVKP